MAYQTLATADAVLKDLYVGPIIEQINYKTYMLDQIDRDSDHVDFTGRRAIVPLHTLGNRKRGSIPDGGTLPTPGTQSYADAIIGIKYHAQGLALTDMAIKQAGKNEGAFVNLLDEETKRLAQDFKKDINRQVYGDGTGLLATVTAGGAGVATVTVDSTQYLQVGDPIDVLVRATGAAFHASSLNLTILSIDRTTRVVTFTSVITGTTDNTLGLYIAGNSFGSGGAIASYEMDGLRNITATTGTLHGINRATAGNEYFRGKRQAASGAVAGESLFAQLADDIGAGGLGDVDVFLTTRGIRRRLANTYQSQKRFNDAKAVDIHAGYTAIFVNEIPVIADDDVPKGWVFALQKDAFKWFEVEKPDWLRSEDGTVWQMGVSTTGSGRRTTWEAWWVWYAALGSMAPNRTGAIPDAQDDAG
jgi:hypothetical protein